jgi:hypothetical protein
MSANVVQNDSMDPGEKYLTYAYRTSHPALRWLPTKLAEWIGANLCEELNIPDKQGPLWTAAELNAIITGNLVGPGGPHGHLHTFGILDASSGRTNFSMVDQRRDAIPSIFRATVFGTRIHRLNHHIVYDIGTNIVLHIFALYDIVYDIIN